MVIFHSTWMLFIHVWVCLWKQGVSELPSNLQYDGPSYAAKQARESIIVGVPVLVEKAPANSKPNVVFVLRDTSTSQFPGAIERIVERIQSYFSSYNSIDSLSEREKPQSAAKKNSSVPGQDTSSAQSSTVASAGTSPGNSAKQVDINPTQIGAAGDPNDLPSEPVSVYEITIGPYVVNEPPESVVPDQAPFVPLSVFHPTDESQSLNEIHSGPYVPGNPSIAVTLLPPFEEPQKVPGYVYEPPCTTTPKPSPLPVTYLPPENSGSISNEIYEQSTVSTSTTTTVEPVPLEYLPPNVESHIQGPFIYELSSTTLSPLETTQKVPIEIELPTPVVTTTQDTPCSHPPTTTSTTTEKPACKHTTTTTTRPKPTTTTTTTTTTTPKPTTQPPCHTTTTTTKPTTKQPCYSTTTPKPTTLTPCHTTKTTTTPKPTKAPCEHEIPTEPSWSYLPPTHPPHYIPAGQYPDHHLEPDHQPETFSFHFSFRPMFRHKSKFLHPLKRLLGLY